MASTEIENMSSHNLATNGKAKKAKSQMAPLFGERKRLQTIQLSSEKNHLTRPGDAGKNAKDKLKKISTYYKPVTVYVDPEPEPSSEQCEADSLDGGTCSCQCHSNRSVEDKSTATDDNDLLDFMTAEPDLEEWKDLAETRRQALDESLVENQQLHFEVGDYKTQLTSLTQEMSDMAEENRRLSQQRDYFATILKKLVDEDEDSSTDTSSGCSTEPSGERSESSVSPSREQGESDSEQTDSQNVAKNLSGSSHPHDNNIHAD